MRIQLLVLIAAAGACAPREEAPNPARDIAIARAAIAAQVAEGARAAREKDIDAYIAQIPDDIPMRDAQGNVIPLDTFRAQVVEAWRSIKVTRELDVQVTDIELHGDAAVVFLNQKWDRLMIRPNGAVDTIISTSTKRENWRKTAKGWRAYDGVTTHSRTTVNGAVLTDIPALQGAGRPPGARTP
jgi:hypothetical protein